MLLLPTLLLWLHLCSAQTPRQSSTDRYVFAHFMVGFVDEYVQSDWASDFALAHSKGIDGFALNCDGSDSNPTQLGYAYTAAEVYNVNATSPFVLFISPDFVHYTTSDASSIATLISPHITSSAQLLVDGKPFVSSFDGEGMDWASVASTLGTDLYVVPYYTASSSNAEDTNVDGLFSWYAWPGQDSSAVVDQNMTTSMDETYIRLLQAANKTYMAPVSPWFYTHLAASSGYPKNYLLYSDTLWPTRWAQLLSLASTYPSTLRFIEVITWNDWTESSLIGPYKGGEMSDDVYLWAEGFDHQPLMEMMQVYIDAFKQGLEEVQVDQDLVTWWYRPSLKSAQCDGTDSVGSVPTGWEMPSDSVFVHAMLTTNATVTVTSGGVGYDLVLEPGVQLVSVPMSPGAQEVAVTMGDGRSAQAQGSIDVTAGCYNGEYNFNILSGVLGP